ncbi:PapD-like protein [Crucibulum laeve]|uniref:PapD-like protein n=1 Tax=Crucibulum laeve TaxID=68775 RepID=A0A5C3M5W7_9AGAR|nr:PapD-like protein [Crucibulum laeve]
MSVSLNPSNALGFRRPLTQLVKRSLTITNNNSQPVAFKVKTTAPKLYCVRPNSGRVEPGETVEVSVMLQAMREEPPLNAKCRDKFLIQSTIISPDKETLSLQDIWASPEANEEGKVHQQKLRVAYLPAEGQTLEEEDESVPQVNASVLHAPNDRFDTVHPPPNGHTAIPVFNPPSQEQHRPSTPPADFSVAREESHESPPQDAAPPVSEPIARPPSPPPAVVVHEPIPEPAPVPVPPPETAKLDELSLRYNEAQAEIESLRATLAQMAAVSAPPTELRRRTRALSDAGSTAETDIQTVVDDSVHHQDGVPLQVVVIIALGVFITTYLFF